MVFCYCSEIRSVRFRIRSGRIQDSKSVFAPAQRGIPPAQNRPFRKEKLSERLPTFSDNLNLVIFYVIP
jgi:hypothetical protein